MILIRKALKHNFKLNYLNLKSTAFQQKTKVRENDTQNEIQKT